MTKWADPTSKTDALNRLRSSRGRLWKEIVGPAGFALTTITTYDHHNDKLTVTNPRTVLASFNYDDLNRLYRIEYPTTSTEAGSLASSKFGKSSPTAN